MTWAIILAQAQTQLDFIRGRRAQAAASGAGLSRRVKLRLDRLEKHALALLKDAREAQGEEQAEAEDHP
jgi:hypothetical protein